MTLNEIVDGLIVEYGDIELVVLKNGDDSELWLLFTLDDWHSPSFNMLWSVAVISEDGKVLVVDKELLGDAEITVENLIPVGHISDDCGLEDKFYSDAFFDGSFGPMPG